MCAIAGLLRTDGAPVDPADLQAMAAAQAHRGPDGQGTHVDGPVGLTHCRLAILDLTPAGAQPMSNEDGTVWVVYNGQLFDFAGTRDWLESRGHRFRSRTDTEILVHLYEEKGEDLLEDVEGMFAFAVWDARRRRLVLARDRLGIKPLYYVRRGGRFAFASELRGLLAVPGLASGLDDLALTHFLYQSSVPGHTCIAAGVRRLAPGELLIVEDGSVRSRRYWTLAATAEDAETSFAAAAEDLTARLDAAVRSHLVADVPIGAFLSGGLDSTAVVAAASTAGERLETFSIRIAGGGPEDESGAAALVARRLGTEHHELVVGPEVLAGTPEVLGATDEPFAVVSALALRALAAAAREHVKVVLTGDGADEILGGYPWRHEPEIGRGSSVRSAVAGAALTAVRSARGAAGSTVAFPAQLLGRARRMLARPAERYAELVAAFTPEELAALLVPDRRRLAAQAWEENPVRRAYDAAREERDPVNRRLRVDVATTLADEMLAKVDRMTMGCGLEARVPFLSTPLVEWCFRQPGRFKVRGGKGKRLLRRALSRRVPEVARRRKHGFNLPLGAWLRGPARSLVVDTVSPEVLRRRGLFEAASALRLRDAHLSGRGDHARKLFSLVVLEVWLSTAGRAAGLS